MKKKEDETKWDLTWEDIAEQAIANDRKDNPPKKRVKKYI